MGMNIVGNVNGSYKAPQIDLFEIAKTRGIEQTPVKTVASLLKNDAPIKVNISKEGLQALRGSELLGSTDLDSRIKQMEYISEHQPIESFSNRMSRELQESYAGLDYENRPSIEDKGNTVLNSFKRIADEIISGYEDGSRVRFVEDSHSADGYRRLTMNEELAILKEDFDDFVESRFGKEHQEQSAKAASAINDIQKIKDKYGLGNVVVYEPERIPEKFVENLIIAGNRYLESLLK